MATARERIFCAIDTPEREAATALAAGLGDTVGGLKLGLEFFVANGPDAVRAVAGNRPLFLDLKLHDIPNTVAGAVRSAARLRPRFLTLHASGGAEMMRAAAAARDEVGTGMRLLAVSVLTSLADDDLTAVGQRAPAGDQVRRLAALAQSCGIDGVVASPQEVAMLRAECGPGLLLVIPGVRPAGSGADDQKRTMTPAGAIAAGADYLVIGRPITRAADPAEAARRIVAEIEAGGR
jgi:orotidine-5'-phosphate decarboxylase